MRVKTTGDFLKFQTQERKRPAWKVLWDLQAASLWTKFGGKPALGDAPGSEHTVFGISESKFPSF